MPESSITVTVGETGQWVRVEVGFNVLTLSIREACELHHALTVVPQCGHLDWLRKNCRIVFYPPDGRYPIEHAPGAKKDQWDAIMVEADQYQTGRVADQRDRLDWWIKNAEGIAEDRAKLRDTLRELNHRVHSGYDFNADPDNMTLRVGEVLSAPQCPDKAIEFPKCGSKAWIDREVQRCIEKGD